MNYSHELRYHKGIETGASDYIELGERCMKKREYHAACRVFDCLLERGDNKDTIMAYPFKCLLLSKLYIFSESRRKGGFSPIDYNSSFIKYINKLGKEYILLVEAVVVNSLDAFTFALTLVDLGSDSGDTVMDTLQVIQDTLDSKLYPIV
jgi:hypothetical protein